MRRALIAAALGSTLAACSGGSDAPATASSQTASRPTTSTASPSAPTPGAGAAGADWPTYHGTGDRAGLAPAAALAGLRTAWAATLDAAVYAQPVVADGRVVVATENNSVYAMAPGTGHMLWHRRLRPPATRSDLPCGNIDPLGITGTPAYDASTRSVLAVTETAGAHHTLVALDVATGRLRWQRDLDVAPGRDRHAEQQRGALLVAHGRVYVAFGGLFGDCGNYVGYVTAVRVDGRGPVLHYSVPTAREAGIWAAPGPVLGPGGDIYVASGNGAEVGGHYDDSDSVLRLSPDLHRRILFAPATWREDNAQDLDLGSMSPAVVGDRLVIAGKRGEVYLLDPSLGGVGGELARLSGCAGYGGAAVVGSDVVMPCDGGLRLLHTGRGSLRWGWRSGLTGSPVAVRGAVYGLDQSTGDLVELRLTDGHELSRVHVGGTTRFVTPAPVGRHVFVGTTSGLVAVAGDG